MTWYPPAMLLSLIPGTWNVFVILAYVLAGCFAYCYAYTVTASCLAATVTGIIYSMSGFMMSHLGHITMIHAAAWMPLFICALEQLRHRFSRLWLAIGILAISCCFLSGHPQIWVYTITLGCFYAGCLGWRSPVGRWRYYGWVIGITVISLGICAIQILPTIELSQLSLRADMTFEDFTSFSLSLWESPQLLFPYLFGSHFEPPFNFYNVRRWGEWFITETTGYIGFLPLFLGVIGTISQWPRQSIVRFWLCTALIALLLTFGGDTWLGHILYQVPIHNKFRALARHFVEVAFAVSVLAGFGIVAIQQHLVSKRLIRQTLLCSLGVMLCSVLSLNIFQPYFQAKAAQVGIVNLSLLPWNNQAIALPLVVFSLAWMTCLCWYCWRRTRWAVLMLLTTLVLDLASFGWLWEWQVDQPAVSDIVSNSKVEIYRDSLQANHQRMFSQYEKSAAVFPNLTRLWDLPNVGGYTPLVLQRFHEMMQILPTGSLQQFPAKLDDHRFDLMAVKYLFDTTLFLNQPSNSAAQPADSGLILGAGVCATPSTQTAGQIDIPDLDDGFTDIELVTTMGCAPAVPDNAELLTMQLVDAQGNIATRRFLAGRDTAESAYDCPDVQPLMQHQRAQIFNSFPITRSDGRSCSAHEYISTITLAQPQKLRALKLQWTTQQAVLHVKQIRLINRQRRTMIPLSSAAISPRWRQVDTFKDGVIYENQQVLPRTWLVPETIQLPPAAILKAIQTGQLPDGRSYHPAAIALVEDTSAQLHGTVLQPSDQAAILSRQASQMVIRTEATTPTFLVLSDVFYPGWVATIDGQRTKIFPTNYVQRGVKVPAGEHVIEFRFEPTSFRLGISITVAALFAATYWLSRQPHSA